MAVAAPGTKDPGLWNQARTSGSILITADLGFWNDRQYPLAQSPGLVIVRGRTADDKIAAARGLSGSGISSKAGGGPRLARGVEDEGVEPGRSGQVVVWVGKGDYRLSLVLSGFRG